MKAYYDYGLFQPLQIASIIALRHCIPDGAAQALLYQKRRDILCDGLERAGWELNRSRRPRCSSGSGSRNLTAGKARCGSPSSCWKRRSSPPRPAPGSEKRAKGYLRLALVENEKRLRQAVAQIRRAFPVPSA